VHNGTQSGLALNYSIGNAHLAAQSGKEHNQLDRVNIIGDQDQGCLFVLNEADNMVEAVFNSIWLLTNIFFLLAI